QRGVYPGERLPQCGGRYILLGIIEHSCKRVVAAVWPDTVKVLVGPSAKQQDASSSSAICGLCCREQSLHRGVWGGPSTIGKPAAEVFIGAPGCLHDAVERQIGSHYYSAHGCTSPFPKTSPCSGAVSVLERAAPAGEDPFSACSLDTPGRPYVVRDVQCEQARTRSALHLESIERRET